MEVAMGKSVLISGASSGIGKALSLELDRQGYRVFAGVRNAEDAEALHNLASPGLSPIMLDITDVDKISTACREVSEKTVGTLDCLVNNAGINISGGNGVHAPHGIPQAIGSEPGGAAGVDPGLPAHVEESEWQDHFHQLDSREVGGPV
jgi:NAD(P)-dependent dehydrogenase (short-subunit alcohol dehydrogenase family)